MSKTIRYLERYFSPGARMPVYIEHELKRTPQHRYSQHNDALYTRVTHPTTSSRLDHYATQFGPLRVRTTRSRASSAEPSTNMRYHRVPASLATASAQSRMHTRTHTRPTVPTHHTRLVRAHTRTGHVQRAAILLHSTIGPRTPRCFSFSRSIWFPLSLALCLFHGDPQEHSYHGRPRRASPPSGMEGSTSVLPPHLFRCTTRSS